MTILLDNIGSSGARLASSTSRGRPSNWNPQTPQGCSPHHIIKAGSLAPHLKCTSVIDFVDSICPFSNSSFQRAREKSIVRRPQYHRKYEIYSLGLLLFEIGLWNTIDRAVKSTLLPKDFKGKATDRCTIDLPFFVGTKYRDVVLRCLNCANIGCEEDERSMDILY